MLFTATRTSGTLRAVTYRQVGRHHLCMRAVVRTAPGRISRRMHIAEALGRLAARRHQKCLELLTCSVCEVRAGPDTREDGAATIGAFKEARTAKKQVCFVGHMSPRLDRWVFDLNPKLPWSEVSAETKQRLRTLSREAEQAYAHKYPFRDAAGWQEKAVKYKPGNLNEAHNILMGDLVHDLHSLYRKYEVHSRRSSHC